MTRYAMAIDTRRCVGCDSCTVACAVFNELPLGIIYNPVVTEGPVGEFPQVHMNHIPLLCMHCENAPCIHACPTGASLQDENGIVWVDSRKCIGCGACVMACPYNARHKDSASGVVMKCDFCRDRVLAGGEPHCVSTCHQRARIFGDLDDPKSEVRRIAHGVHTERLYEDLDTQPQVYYIMGLGGQES